MGFAAILLTLTLQTQVGAPVSAAPSSAPTQTRAAPAVGERQEMPPPAPRDPEPDRPLLTLADAERVALSTQPLLRQAHAATAAAEGRVEQARSGYLPQVVATGQYQRATGNFATRPGAFPAFTTTTFSTPTPSLTTTYDYWNFGVAASQLIYDFGQTSERWRAANRSVDAFKETERTSRNQVLFNIRNAYYNARAQKALVNVAEETLSNQKKHLGQIEGFVRVGTRPEIDLAQAKTAVANARVSLIDSENGYNVARAQLNLAMGVAGGSEYDVTDDASPPVPGEDLPIVTLVKRALAERPELANLTRQREAEELTIRSLEGAYGPSVGAATGATAAGVDLTNLTPNWYAGLNLNWPILQGGLTRGQVHEQQANLSGLRAQEDQEKLQVHLDVEQAVLALGAAKASIEATEEALTSARDQLRLAEGRYTAGVGSIIELGDSQVALTSASAQRVQADFNLSVARAQLHAALGTP